MMPRAILRFDLPEEDKEFQRVCAARDMLISNIELRQFIIQKEKHTDLSVSDAKLLEEIREKFLRILEENNVLQLFE